MTQLKDKYSIGIGPDGLPGFFDDPEAVVYVRENDDNRKAKWIGEHVMRGWIAYDGQLFDPESYEIIERIKQ